MKYFQILFLLLFISISSSSQINAFKNEITFYNTYRTGKIDSLKVNETNHKRLIKRINDIFRSFVLNREVERYDSFKTDWHNSNNRFLNLQNVAEISIHTFRIENKVFDVYAYTSFVAKNYFIKDRDANVIMREGDGELYLVDTMHVIDKDHILLIEKFGDLNISKKAVVLKQSKKWDAIKGFYGTTLDSNKKIQRKYFQLYCTFEVTLSAPRDINKLYYSSSTKTLSFRKYDNEGGFRIINAEWLNNSFKIDDVNSGEQIDSYSIPVPAE